MQYPSVSKLVAMIATGIGLCFATSAHALTINLSAGSSATTINNAINSVSAAGGGTVNLAAGNYNITSGILMNSNVTLSGAGIGQTNIIGPGTAYTWTMILSSGNGLHNITVQNMTVNGNCPQSQSNGSNGYVNQAGLDATCPTYGSLSYVLYDNLEVENCSVGMHGANVNNYIVNDCTVHDCGMWVRAALWQHDLYFNACEYVQLSYSTFRNSWQGCGVHLDSTTGNGTNWTVTHCNCESNAECGILVQNNINNVDIDNSYIYDNGYGANYANNQQGQDGLNFSGGSGCTIASNNFSTNYGYGLQVFSGSGSITNNWSHANVLGQYSISGSWTESGNE